MLPVGAAPVDDKPPILNPPWLVAVAVLVAILPEGVPTENPVAVAVGGLLVSPNLNPPDAAPIYTHA